MAPWPCSTVRSISGPMSSTRPSSQPVASDVLLAQLASLLLGGPAPHARVLVRGEGVLEARGLGFALPADGLGVLDLLDGRSGGTDREEQVGIGVATRRQIAPVVAFDGELKGAMGEGHDVPPRRVDGHDEFVTSFTCRHGAVNAGKTCAAALDTVAGMR